MIKISYVKVNAEYTPQKVHDIDTTPFFAEVKDLRFYFTSFFYLDNFEKRFNEKLKILTSRIQPYLPAKENTNIIGLVSLNALGLYSEIEKRGCRIENLKSGVVYRCLEEIIINVQYSVE